MDDDIPEMTLDQARRVLAALGMRDTPTDLGA